MNDKEFILCAANWYPNFPLIMPDLPMFKPDNITDGIVICGVRNYIEKFYEKCRCLHLLFSFPKL